jgi:ABC-2 type transport system permease protein
MDFLTIILLITLSTLAEIILWYSVFDSNDSINGYDLKDTLRYYLLVPFVGSITFLSLRVARDIKQGKFSNQLLRPYKIIKAVFFDFLGKKMSYLMISFPIFSVLLVMGVMVVGLDLDYKYLLTGLCFSVFGMFFHFLLELNIGWLAFWLDDIWSFRHFKSIILFLFSGMGFPFAFLPDTLRIFFKFLPFRYLYDVPVRYISGNFGSTNDVIFDISAICIWLSVFYVISKIILSAGLKKYGAFGN